MCPEYSDAQSEIRAIGGIYGLMTLEGKEMRQQVSISKFLFVIHEYAQRLNQEKSHFNAHITNMFNTLARLRESNTKIGV